MTPSRVPSVWATASANGRLAPPESNVRVLMRGSRLELELQREELQQVPQRDDARQPAILHDQQAWLARPAHARQREECIGVRRDRVARAAGNGQGRDGAAVPLVPRNPLQLS